MYETSKRDVALELDAFTTEKHRGDVDLPRHPVEDGLAIADDVQDKGLGYEVTGIVSATPQTADETAGARVDRALEVLEELRLGAELVTVATLHRTYPHMKLSSYTGERDAKKSGQLRVALTFTEIRIATSQKVKILSSKAPKSTRDKLDAGKQVATPAAPAVDKSILATGFDTLFGGP
jgi:hypothetical protein